ncbi:MAG: hypothetical protein JWN46_271, partial [Acidimicrobiales bacterium]|nr:hypothetical protein [Acidimicrobiales bacterium]
APSTPAETGSSVRTVGGGEPLVRRRRAAAPRAARPVPPAETTSRPVRRRRPNALLAVAILGIAGTLAFGTAWRQERSHNRSAASAQGTAATDMRDTAQQFAIALTTFDGIHIDADVAKLNGFGTGQFGDELSQFFSTKIRTELKTAQASSRGDVRSVFVESFDGERGRVFAVVDQTIANNRFPQPQADTLRLDIGLKKVNGAWKVFDLQTVGTAVGGGTAGTATTPTSTP